MQTLKASASGQFVNDRILDSSHLAQIPSSALPLVTQSLSQDANSFENAAFGMPTNGDRLTLSAKTEYSIFAKTSIAEQCFYLSTGVKFSHVGS